jgi:hypothetical protein
VLRFRLNQKRAVTNSNFVSFALLIAAAVIIQQAFVSVDMGATGSERLTESRSRNGKYSNHQGRIRSSGNVRWFKNWPG